MNTTLEPRNSPSLRQETRPQSIRPHRTQRDNRWAATCATAGAAVWAGIAVLARAAIAPLGAIELLFLFAPLVIVPLGMELSREIAGSDPLNSIARRLQPPGAALAVLAMWLPPGRRAGLAAMGWLLVCLLLAGSGVVDLVRALWTDAKSLRAMRFVVDMAGFDLAVGGVWLVASRLGMRPMGIQEPIGLLTAVHFHFAGFATAIIAATTLQFAERRGEHLWLKYLAPLVAGLPCAVAAGFVVSPVLKMVAALLFSISVAALAMAVRGATGLARDWGFSSILNGAKTFTCSLFWPYRTAADGYPTMATKLLWFRMHWTRSNT